MYRLGLIHYNLGDMSLKEILEFANAAGFDCIELRNTDVYGPGIEDPKRRATEVRELVEAQGLEVSALSAGNDFIYLDEDRIREQVQRMREICRLATILGTSVIRTEGGRPKDEVPDHRYVEAVAGCLARCLEFVVPGNLYLAVDNHGLVTNDADLQVELLERVGSNHVGANLDTMNYRWAGHDLKTVDRYYETIAPYVLHTHLKDGIGTRGHYRGTVLGRGEINLTYAVECLKKVGYTGVMCAEYEGSEDPRLGYRRCLEWMQDNLDG